MKIYELTPINTNQKGFYGKAFVERNGDKTTLTSYGTKIVEVNNGKIKPLWDGWSMTTGKHIRSFFLNLGLNVEVNKKLWTMIQDGKIKTTKDLEKALN